MSGFSELAVLLAILVIVFGARRLPAMGEAIGRSIVKRRTPRKHAARGKVETSSDERAASG